MSWNVGNWGPMFTNIFTPFARGLSAAGKGKTDLERVLSLSQSDIARVLEESSKTIVLQTVCAVESLRYSPPKAAVTDFTSMLTPCANLGEAIALNYLLGHVPPLIEDRIQRITACLNHSRRSDSKPLVQLTAQQV